MKKPIVAFFAALIAISASGFAVSAAQTDSGMNVAEASQQAQASYPVVTDFYNTADGTEVSWKAYPNAARYGLFVWNGDSWKGIATTSGLSLTHKGLKSGEVYRYTVRAIGSDGEFCSDFNREGFENTFIAPPEMTAVRNSEKGVFLEWTSRKGAENYRVYRKSGNSGWSRLTDTASNFFTDESAVSGTTYSYTVRAITADGSEWTSYYTDGKSVRYIKAPVITDFANTATGTRIYWDKCGGASKYRVFYLDRDNVWRGLGSTSSNSFTSEDLLSGESYTYTVRCLDSDGNYISDYDHEGKSYLFLTTPKITSLNPVTEGVEVSWGSLAGAVNYRVYRKTADTDWRRVGDTTATTLVDRNAPSGVQVSYTVRAITADGSDWTSYFNSGKSITYIKTPVITGFYNTANGTEIMWDKCGGAAKYRVFVLENGSWKGLGNTTSESFVNKNVKSGESYTYTVRCLDKNGDFISAYDKDGKSFIFLTPPVISSLDVTENGVVIKWNADKNAENFRIYRKTGGSDWSKLTDTAATSYTDRTAASGKEYSYTVRCITADGSEWTSYYNSGKSVMFVKTPQVKSFENVSEGAKLSWDKCDGAYKYGVFYLDGENGWKGISSTTDTYFIDKTVKNGETRTYTVRCLDKASNFISPFNRTGWTNRYFAPPAILSVSNAVKGNNIKWNAVDGAAGYRLYRRTISSGWARLFDSTPETSYNDLTAEKNNAYAYTLRLVNEKGELISSYIDDTKFYYNGAVANGTLSINGKSYVFVNGKIRQGYVKIGNDTYYYNSDDVMLKDCLVGSSAEGFRYAGKDGKIDFNFTGVTKNSYGYWYLEKGTLDFTIRTGVTYGGYDWNVENGRATKVTTEKDKTYHRAFLLLDKVCDRNMSKSDKLWKMFRYIQNAYTELNPRIPHYHGDGWEVLYANDMLVYGKGNCISYGSEFAFLAKAIGYDNCYACHSGGHGWAEIEGKVYDPEWGRHFFDHTYFGIDYYNNPTSVNYTVIKGGAAWMHVKI